MQATISISSLDLTNEKVHSSDAGATLEEVFNQWYKPLVMYANTLLKDIDEAEDIVQQVFVNQWERNPLLSAHTSIKALLFTSVYHACLNRIKHSNIKQQYAEKQAKAPLQIQSPEIEGKHFQKHLEESLEQLPEQCRKIFELSRFQGLKYKEIALKLGISIKTVENQMGKALGLLRVLMKDYLPIFLTLIFHQL